MGLEEQLLDILGRVEVAPRRMLLETGEVRATVPMLRGVWGRAVRHLDLDAYAVVFEGRVPNARPGSERTPLYLIRPAPPDPTFAPAMDWMLIGSACRFDDILSRAWDVASGMGLGPRREPFSVKRILALDVRSVPTSVDQKWSLRVAAEAFQPVVSGGSALSLRFNAPLRILRRGRLIDRPALADVAIAALRRVALLAGPAGGDAAHDLARAVVDAAGRIKAAPWRGERADFVRWSGSQQRELDLRGVSGGFALPAGAGELWPLLIAACWVHVGKGTVFGLGQLELSLPALSETEYSKAPDETAHPRSGR